MESAVTRPHRPLGGAAPVAEPKDGDRGTRESRASEVAS
jgi:hypothetical protein